MFMLNILIYTKEIRHVYLEKKFCRRFYTKVATGLGDESPYAQRGLILSHKSYANCRR